jgi:hypothetical protein
MTILSRVRGSVPNNHGFWIWWLVLLPLLYNYNSSQSMTALDSLQSLLDYECLLFHCDWLGSGLRINHFFSFRWTLVNIRQLNIQLLNSLTTERLNSCELTWTNTCKWITCPIITRGEQNIHHHLEHFLCYYLLFRYYETCLVTSYPATEVLPLLTA